MNDDLADGKIDFNATEVNGPTLTTYGIARCVTEDQTNVVSLCARNMSARAELPPMV